MRVAIYVRTAAANKSEKKRLIGLCENYASAKSWSIAAIYSDPIDSKPWKEREGLQDLMRGAEGKFDILLTPTINHLSRDSDELVQIGRAMRKARITLATFDLGLWAARPLPEVANDD